MTKTVFLPVTVDLAEPLIGLLIADYSYWMQQQWNIKDWYEQTFEHSINLRGMIIRFQTESDRTLFLLKWAVQ